ncbi:MAG: hypothetical protein V7785_21840 [Bermanella sp.]
MGKLLNAITASQIEEMTTQEIKEAILSGEVNWVTLQMMGIELADRCEKLEPTIDLPNAA